VDLKELKVFPGKKIESRAFKVNETPMSKVRKCENVSKIACSPVCFMLRA
jgi:hypothetical protein